jgi:hypothetical protein
MDFDIWVITSIVGVVGSGLIILTVWTIVGPYRNKKRVDTRRRDPNDLS